ncbi:DUF4410 domain-containing protein [Arenimonas sp.]|uniref:DUF4410 domain-containing protein n=1 Tax=Arenimonas sp. TaxID=1872635 RepID=UPI0039E6EA54
MPFNPKFAYNHRQTPQGKCMNKHTLHTARLGLVAACFAAAGIASAQEATSAQPATTAEVAAAPAAATTAEAAPEPQAASAAATAAAPAVNLPIDCIEVETFAVSADEKVEGQTDRAAAIPPRNLEIIRDAVIRFLPREAKGVTAMAPGTCPNIASAAKLRGDILDFRKGNMALRYFVGFGAGSQKVRVRLSLDRKNDGSQLVQTEVADTKWAGVFGGTNTKGLEDFAEKAAKAAATALKKR